MIIKKVQWVYILIKLIKEMNKTRNILLLLVIIILYGIIGCFFCRRCLNYQIIIANMECDCLTFTYFIVLGICILYNDIFGLIVLIFKMFSSLKIRFKNKKSKFQIYSKII